MQKNKTAEKIAQLIEKIPEIIAYIAIVVLVANDAISGIFENVILFDINARLSVIAIALACLAIYLNAQKKSVDKIIETINKDKLGVEELIPSSKALDLENIFKSAKEIRILTLAGTKIARLGEEIILNELRSGKHKKVTILLANPYSDSIQKRYERDEPLHYETGLDGLDRRLRILYSFTEKMTQDELQRFDVQVFDSYPTCSIVQCDQDIFSTIYGYKLRGSDCPKIHAKVGGSFSDFLLKHFELIYEDSKPLHEWIIEHPSNDRKESRNNENNF
jgi:hypothetical protein